MRKFIFGLAIGFLLLAPLPLVADHVSEASNPIEKLTVQLYWYNHSAEFPPMVASSDPALQSRCDGSATTNFPNLRVEPKVASLRPDGTSMQGDPSEHWQMNYRIRIGTLRADGSLNNARQFWGGEWKHQNSPPHGLRASSTGWEAAQTNVGVGLLATGWVFEFVVTGDISGKVLTASCRFNSVLASGS